MAGRRKGKKTTGPTPFEIGLTGTVEQFREANQRAVDKKNKEGEFAQHLGAADQKELRRGAVQAFHDGQPANIQTALLHIDEFAIHDSYVRLSNEWCPRENIISDLIRAGNEPSVVIHQVLLANVAEDNKQAVLDDALFSLIKKQIFGGKAFIDALLEAGADANAAGNGYKGLALAYAVQHNQPLSVIETLYKKTANFDDAIESMKANGWEDGLVYRVKVLREHFTGTPAMVEIDPGALQKLLDDFKAAQEEIVALREAAQEKPHAAAQEEPRRATRLILQSAGPKS